MPCHLRLQGILESDLKPRLQFEVRPQPVAKLRRTRRTNPSRKIPSQLPLKICVWNVNGFSEHKLVAHETLKYLANFVLSHSFQFLMRPVQLHCPSMSSGIIAGLLSRLQQCRLTRKSKTPQAERIMGRRRKGVSCSDLVLPAGRQHELKQLLLLCSHTGMLLTPCVIIVDCPAHAAHIIYNLQLIREKSMFQCADLLRIGHTACLPLIIR